MRKTIAYIAAIAVIAILTGIAIHHYQLNLGFLSEPSWLSVLASLIVAFLTAVYVLQTQGMLKEMTKAGKAEFLPHIRPSLEYMGPLHVDLLLKNVGKGPAINVDVRFGFQQTEESYKHWLHPLLAPEESYSFLITPSNFTELAEKHDFLVVRGTCEDVFGKKHDVDERIDLKEVHKGWSEARILIKTSLERRLEKISEEVRRVGQEIGGTKRDRRTFPLLIRLGSMEIKQPPLDMLEVAGSTIFFSGKTLDGDMFTQLKKLKEGNIEEVYCSDRHGLIFSGVFEIKKIDLRKEKMGQKIVYSFHVDLGYK